MSVDRWLSSPSCGRTRHGVWCGVASCAVLLCVGSASGQASDEATETKPDPSDPISHIFGELRSLREDFEKLGAWEEQAEGLTRTIDRVWEENGWNSDADQFAKRTAGEVARIPPWDVRGRLGRVADLATERYALTDSQRQRLEASINAEAGWFLVKNAKVLFGQTRDFLSRQSSGTPLTVEQVAEWTRESEPLVSDLRERMDRMAKSFEKTLAPAQREILRRDLESLERRQKYIDKMRQRWARGEWQPRDWGLEGDPVYANWRADPQQQRMLRRRAAMEAARERRERIQAVDETQWERYVRRFVQRHGLDDGQRRSAYSILREMRERAKDYRESRRKELATIPRYRLASHPLGEPLRKLFEELKRRLEPIPTAAQRAAVPPA